MLLIFQKIEIRDRNPVIMQSIKIYPGCRKVYCKDKQVLLTGKEFDVFYTLVINKSSIQSEKNLENIQIKNISRQYVVSDTDS